jgi:signal transduction histidine kinase
VDAIGIFRLEVVDTGVGLSIENQQKIFGEFTQFNKDELQGGGYSK